MNALLNKDPALLDGPQLSFRLVEPIDAAYIYALRRDPTYNTHLSAVTGTILDQANWITRYKDREAQGLEYYFVIDRRGLGPCGLVRLYDITQESLTWGSWILDHNKPPKAALESAVLIYRIAFDGLGLTRSDFEVMHENEHTIAFHRRFGAMETGQTDSHVQFVYTAEQFAKDQAGFLELLEEASK